MELLHPAEKIKNCSLAMALISYQALSYLEATPVHKGESYLVAARFDDEYVKENGRWYFKKVKLTPYFMVPLKEGWAQEDRLKMGR